VVIIVGGVRFAMRGLQGCIRRSSALIGTGLTRKSKPLVKGLASIAVNPPFDVEKCVRTVGLDSGYRGLSTFRAAQERHTPLMLEFLVGSLGLPFNGVELIQDSGQLYVDFKGSEVSYETHPDGKVIGGKYCLPISDYSLLSLAATRLSMSRLDCSDGLYLSDPKRFADDFLRETRFFASYLVPIFHACARDELLLPLALSEEPWFATREDDLGFNILDYNAILGIYMGRIQALNKHVFGFLPEGEDDSVLSTVSPFGFPRTEPLGIYTHSTGDEPVANVLLRSESGVFEPGNVRELGAWLSSFSGRVTHPLVRPFFLSKEACLAHILGMPYGVRESNPLLLQPNFPVVIEHETLIPFSPDGYRPLGIRNGSEPISAGSEIMSVVGPIGIRDVKSSDHTASLLNPSLVIEPFFRQDIVVSGLHTFLNTNEDPDQTNVRFEFSQQNPLGAGVVVATREILPNTRLVVALGPTWYREHIGDSGVVLPI
jgi:hypothetical protein